MKKILNWILGEFNYPESVDSKRRNELNGCITLQRMHILKMKDYTKEQRRIFCDGMEYTVQMEKMMRLMTSDELREYLKISGVPHDE
jgi:hypothetical protein